jgi:hypothetical protein
MLVVREREQRGYGGVIGSKPQTQAENHSYNTF